MKFISCLFAVTGLLLNGCASPPSSPIEHLHDVRIAGWVDRSKATVWLRTRQLDSGGPVVASLLKACQAGKAVEVLVWEGQAGSTRRLRKSCVRVWATNNLDVANHPTTVLVDSEQLVIHGMLDSVGGKRARNEYRAQAFVKLSEARRLN